LPPGFRRGPGPQQEFINKDIQDVKDKIFCPERPGQFIPSTISARPGAAVQELINKDIQDAKDKIFLS
jgi:hypothetical protein